MGYWRTGDNILSLKVMLVDGTVVTLDDTDSSETFPRLHELIAKNLGTVRTHFGTFSRQVSGYGLESLLPERSEEHTSELQSRFDLVCRLLLEKKKKH